MMVGRDALLMVLLVILEVSSLSSLCLHMSVGVWACTCVCV